MLAPGSTVTEFVYIRNGAQEVLTGGSISCVVIRNGIDTVVSTSIDSSSDKAFKVQFVIPSNWAEGDRVHLRYSADYQGYPMTDTKLIGEVSVVAEQVQELDDRLQVLYELSGFAPGVDVTAKPPNSATPGYRATSTGRNQTWVLNPDGTETLSPD